MRRDVVQNLLRSAEPFQLHGIRDDLSLHATCTPRKDSVACVTPGIVIDVSSKHALGQASIKKTYYPAERLRVGTVDALTA